MNRTFNKESYASPLAQYQPKAIATEEDNEGVKEGVFADFTQRSKNILPIQHKFWQHIFAG